MPERVIIADSSCLIALSSIDKLRILQQVYERITITPEKEDSLLIIDEKKGLISGYQKH